MKPRRTHESNMVFQLAGGNEDSDLWVERGIEAGTMIVTSVWQLSAEEREEIAAGANIELTLWSDVCPPVDMRTTTVALGKAPADGS